MNPLRPNWDTLVVIDIETTGVNPFRHQIVSLAMVPLNSDKPSLELYIRYGEPEWQEKALGYFAGFQSTWESEAISPDAACDLMKTYLSENFDKPVTVVGHNVGFDIAFLRQLAYLAGLDELPLVSHRAIDTHTILFLLHMYELVPERALASTGAFSYFGISPPIEKRHSAIGDAIATRELFIHAMALLSSSELSKGLSFIDSVTGLLAGCKK